MEKSYQLHCLLLFLFFFFCNGMDGNTTEMETLLAFKHQFITSDPNNALGGWNSSFPLCNWSGITCTRGQTHVAAIQLSGLALSGTIPPLLSNLSFLISLDLSYNFFHGSLPQYLGRLSLLQRLVLYGNSFTGVIPRALSNCSNLLLMHLSYNQLHGNLPPSLGLLAHLEVLALSVNSLADEIPPSIGNLTSLKYLYLSGNQFSGDIPQELGGLRNLAHFQIAANQLTDMIPSSIYNLSSIQIFSVAVNKLVGQLPKDMGLRFPNLTELHMGGNQLTGTIPSSLSNISGIQYLNLPDNRFQGSMPLLGNMPALLGINLSRNRFSSPTQLNKHFFDSLTNCTLLEELSISDNQIAGSLPVSVANLSAGLIQFNIDHNLFSGSLAVGMYNYPNLTIFDVSGNSFVGSIPRSLASLHNLQFLLLSQNHFGGEIPDIFSNLTWLYRLNLSHNHLSGRIPRSIGDCQHLELLDLSTNNLTGSIPKEIFNLRSLTFNLSLAGNSLHGFLPREVGKLDKVQFMNFSDNQLCGAVPSMIGDCVSLQNLAMARNQFEGQIPKSVGTLIALENLDLSSNDFIGRIPDGLGKLNYLRNLNLSFNHLRGQVPAEGFFTNLSWSALQGNNDLCSEIRATQKRLRIPRCAKDDESSSLALKIILPIAILSAILSFLLCLKCIANTRTQKRNARRPPHSHSFGRRHRKISYKEISSATDNFSLRNLIGEGSFGFVYKGILRVGNDTTDAVAVKVLDLKQSRSMSSFTTECEILGKIQHRNLVKIITSCSSVTPSGADFKAIIMKFMSNGSLDRWLHHSAEKPSMSGRLGLLQRLNISLDVATAMDYLHHDCDPPVVHCDLKPSNVLLDDEMIAHVGDFGLAKILSQPPSEGRSSSLGLKGSIGYIAPEYNYGSQVSTKGDVYSYGILLLEIFTGKMPTDEIFKGAFNLKNFASKVFENRVVEIVDKSLLVGDYYSDMTIISTASNSNGNTSSTSTCSCETMKDGAKWHGKKEEFLAKIIRLALSCAADFPKDRPSIRETLSRMHGIKKGSFLF